MIYVIRSEVYADNVHKIGYSTQSREGLLRRYQTSIGKPEILFEYKTRDYKKIEKKIHENLNEYRMYPNRELFKCDLGIIKKCISECLKNKYTYVNPLSIKNGFGFMEFLKKWDGENVDNTNSWFEDLRRVMGLSISNIKFFFKQGDNDKPITSDNMDILRYYSLNIGPKKVSFHECLTTRHKMSLISYKDIIRTTEEINPFFKFLFGLSDNKYKISDIYELYKKFCEKEKISGLATGKLSSFMTEIYEKSKSNEKGKSHTVYDILRERTNKHYRKIYGIDYSEK